MDATNIVNMEPRGFIELNDIINGGRKIAVVDETGRAYYDIHAPVEMAKPLFVGLDPVNLPQIAEMLMELPQDEKTALTDIWHTMTQKGLDVLTIVRALRWAVENHSTEPELVERMGRQATQSILDGRNVSAKAMVAA